MPSSARYASGFPTAGAAFAADVSPSGPHVVASTVDNQSVTGTLVELSIDGVAVHEAFGAPVVKLSAARLVSITPEREDALPVDRPTLAVAVVDGSLLAATGFQAHDGVAEVRLTSGLTVSLPTKRIEWVRFRAPGGDDPLAVQWAEIVTGVSGGNKPAETSARADGGRPSRGSEAAAADVLVVRKKLALDYLEGVATGVDDEAIVFEVDHEPVTVKRAKVEGLIYYRAKEKNWPTPPRWSASEEGPVCKPPRSRLATDHLQAHHARGRGNLRCRWPTSIGSISRRRTRNSSAIWSPKASSMSLISAARINPPPCPSSTSRAATWLLT